MIANMLKWQLNGQHGGLLPGRSWVQITAKRELLIMNKGIINLNLNCDMVYYSIHVQRLVQVEHTHPEAAYRGPTQLVTCNVLYDDRKTDNKWWLKDVIFLRETTLKKKNTDVKGEK